MSFKPAFLTLWSVQHIPSPPNLPQWWGYVTKDDNIATVSANGYFNVDPGYEFFNTQFHIGDLFYCVCTDGVIELQITALTPNVTMTAFSIAANSVGTAALQAQAVTTAKIANNAVTSAQIANNTIGDGQISANGLSSASLALNTIQYIQVPMTAAQWNAMSATPFQILAAPGAGLIYQVDNVWYDMTFVSAQYASGGVVNLQYDNTATGAGVGVTADTAAATITGLAASSIVIPGLSSGAKAQSTTVNKGLFMSNKTGAFTTGDGTWKINVAYRIITA